MSPSRLVLICGYVACHKTTLTLWVAPRIPMNIVATYAMGEFDPSTLAGRETRYDRLVTVLDAYLKQGLPVWLDGNFPTRIWRRKVLDAARAAHVREVVVVHCVCFNANVLEHRFVARRRDPQRPDGRSNTIAEYHRSVQQFETLDDSEFHDIESWEVLRFDSCENLVAPEKPVTPFGALVRDRILDVLPLIHRIDTMDLS